MFGRYTDDATASKSAQYAAIGIEGSAKAMRENDNRILVS
jgi:hypothetical protein